MEQVRVTKQLPTKLLNFSKMATGYQGPDSNDACEDDNEMVTGYQGPDSNDVCEDDNQMVTGYQGLDLNEACKDDNLTYDWEECETLQRVRAFSISDYGTEYLLNQPSIEYPLVSEPPTLSDR